jgi:hypothetical protein
MTYDRMISRDAEPIGHVSPRRPIELNPLSHKKQLEPIARDDRSRRQREADCAWQQLKNERLWRLVVQSSKGGVFDAECPSNIKHVIPRCSVFGNLVM